MAKTLQKLVMEELGSTDPDKAEALIDVVLDWLERTARNDNLYMSDGWRQRAEDNRQAENSTGTGR